MLIDGELVEAGSGKRFANINPATEEVLGVTADAGRGEMAAAIAAARNAFDATEWSTDVKFRVHCLRQLQEGLDRHREELRALTVAEAGVPVSLTKGPHLDAAIALATWVIGRASCRERVCHNV